MNEDSPKKREEITEEDKEFSKIEEAFVPKIKEVFQPIYYDGKQYSVKIPPKFMKAVGHIEGHGLRFRLIPVLPTEEGKKPKLEVLYEEERSEKD